MNFVKLIIIYFVVGVLTIIWKALFAKWIKIKQM